VTVAVANDRRLWVLLRAHGQGRIVRIVSRRRVRALPRTVGTPTELLDGSPPAAYLALAAAGRVSLIDPAGHLVLSRRVPGVAGVAFDQLGRLWYSGRRRGVVGVVDPVRGTVRETPAGVPGRRLGDVARGPTGDLWLRDEGGRTGLIGRRGRVRWLAPRAPATPGAQQHPGRLAGDSRTGVWSTWPHGVLVHTEPSGASTRLRLPASFGSADAVVTGPDGNLWVASATRHRLARVGPDGGLTLFATPLPPGAAITDLSRAPGVLFLTTRRPGRLYAISPPDLESKLAPG
jgi:streptogramin lyase